MSRKRYTAEQIIRHLRQTEVLSSKAGSNLGMMGVDIVTIGELLGQKTIAMTKRYVNPTFEHKKRAVQKINSGVMDTYLDTSLIDQKRKIENRCRN